MPSSHTSGLCPEVVDCDATNVAHANETPILNSMINFLRAWKFETGFLFIIAAALLVWGVTVYFSPEMRRARDAREYLEQLQADYANDTYGGASPLENHSSFLHTLRKCVT